MFKAIGFVIALIAIRLLMSDVYHAFEHAVVSFFHLAEIAFSYSPQSVTQMYAAGVNYVPAAAPLPPALMAP
jgi:hypothetical protein